MLHPSVTVLFQVLLQIVLHPRWGSAVYPRPQNCLPHLECSVRTMWLCVAIYYVVLYHRAASQPAAADCAAPALG
jgi:hypothetical protein